MPKIFTSKTQKLGEIGENIACRFLMKHDFVIQERNFTQKWGEIDIIASKENRIYFIEVKSVSRSNIKNVSRETLDNYKPEDNMHPWKMKRMAKTIQSYMMSYRVPDYMEWQVDLIVIFIDLNNKKTKIKVISDLIL
jgi:putative endonuclease